jgi:VCBS repeat protein
VRYLVPIMLALSTLAPAQHLLSSPQRLDANVVGVGDFDGDGDVDLLRRNTILALQGTVTVALNDGFGSFSDGPQTPLVVGNAVFAGVADFSGDGLPDFAVVSPASGNPFGPGVFVHPSLGGGNFGPAQFVALPGGVSATATADVDGNGRVDIAVIHAAPNTGDRRLRWLLSEFDGSFSLGQGLALPLFGAPFDLLAIDVDDDGTPDLVGTDSPAALVLYPSVGTSPTVGSTVTVANNPNAILNVSVADMDGDGRDDVFCLSSGVGGIETSTVLNRGVMPWLSSPSQFFPQVGFGLASHGDWDGDGDVDTLVRAYSDFQGDYSLLLNDGTGTSELAFSRPVGGLSGSGVALVDLNQDGHLDFVGGNDLWFGESSRLDPFPSLGLDNNRSADFDGDGDLDVIGAQGLVALNDGGGRFETATLGWPTPPSGFFYGGEVLVRDFDDDGIPDYLVPYFQSTGPFMPPNFIEMRILQGQVQSAFVDIGAAAAPGQELNLQDGRTTPFVDIDGDGDRDILALDGIWRSTSPGQLAAPDDVYPGWRPIDAADLDNDGDVDILAYSGTGPFQVAVLRQTASLSFSVEIISTSGFSNEPQSNRTQLADLDDDGDLDLIFDDGTGGTTAVKMAENLGSSFAASLTLPTPNLGATTIRVADLDGDGASDVVIGNGGSVGPAVYVFRRDGAWPNYEEARAYFGGRFDEVVDLDHDGDLDLLGPRVTFNRRHFGVAGGGTRQYGQGSAGSGGFVPLLSALGTFRPGDLCELRLRHAMGGATAILLAGPAAAELVGSPFPGSTLLVSPLTEFFYLNLSGPFAAAGEGGFEIPYFVPAFFAGLPLYLQVAVVDFGGSSPLTMSNGVEVRFGL